MFTGNLTLNSRKLKGLLVAVFFCLIIAPFFAKTIYEKQIEPLLTYLGDNMYKHQPWDAYQKSYKTTWDHGAPQDMTAPPHVSPESPK